MEAQTMHAAHATNATTATKAANAILTETTPLLEHVLPRPRPPRSVTFHANPVSETIEPEPSRSSASALRNGQSSSSSSSSSVSPAVAVGHGGGTASSAAPPMLSALNSRLRRRNSHGGTSGPVGSSASSYQHPATSYFTSVAPFSAAAGAAPAPKVGPQRSTKNAQKLKLLPNPEPDEDEVDEESGRDVYSQYTRIKDPTARRDAARLGKADRERLPRVTAYCTANKYQLDGLMRFLKGRGKGRGANPKLIDECIYTPYNYNHSHAASGPSERERHRHHGRDRHVGEGNLPQQDSPGRCRTVLSDPDPLHRPHAIPSPPQQPPPPPADPSLTSYDIRPVYSPVDPVAAYERRHSTGGNLATAPFIADERLPLLAHPDPGHLDAFSLDGGSFSALSQRHFSVEQGQNYTPAGGSSPPQRELSVGGAGGDTGHMVEHHSMQPDRDGLNRGPDGGESFFLDTEVHTPEVFLFDYGVVVVWGMSAAQEQRFLKEIAKFETEKLAQDDVEAEFFNFYYTREYQARIYNDFITLRDKNNYMTKLAISHALAQSVKTSLFEELIASTIDTCKDIPTQIAISGHIALSRSQINMQIGELFILRINIHLNGSVLDTPELFWVEPQLEPVYQAVRSYLEMDQRVGLLTERLDVIADLLAVLKDQLSHGYGEKLEWIVIVLIAAEIFVAVVNILVDLYAAD